MTYVEFLLLVVDPARVRIVRELRGAQEVARRVRLVLLDLQAEELEEANEDKDLEKASRGQLVEGLDRILENVIGRLFLDGSL